jgi:hypothetical protein
MPELLDKILTAAAIPILIIVGIGNIYIIRLMRKATAGTKKEHRSKRP